LPAPGAHLAVSAITLPKFSGEVRVTRPAVHRVLARITVEPVTAEIARRAGELLGATGLSGHRCAIDAVVAATALLERPVVLLTSDLDDLTRLVEEPERPKAQRVTVIHTQAAELLPGSTSSDAAFECIFDKCSQTANITE
jgi:hypothetical protein